MDGVLWTTRDYLRLRRQYGITLNTLQALQHRMADMFAEVELSRSILFRALSLLMIRIPPIGISARSRPSSTSDRAEGSFAGMASSCTAAWA